MAEIDVSLFSRRSVLASAALAAMAPCLLIGRESSDERAIEEVQDRARKVGLAGFGVSRNDQYLAVGDAPEGFRERALEILQGLAKDYRKHFTEKGFPVEKPDGRLVLVALASRASFASFLGKDPGAVIGGFYDPGSNHLVFHDNRGSGGHPQAERANTLVLFHEATHQLTFNTGLLDRGGDVPLAIAEGLGTYGEVRSPNGKTRIGDVNRDRLRGLESRGATPARLAMPPMESLIADDSRVEAEDTQQIAYSECWLLVHYLMKTPARLPGIRAYLKAIWGRKDASRRMDDWKRHLGDPATLDRDLAAYLRKLENRRG